MTKDEVNKINELSNSVDIFTKNEKMVKVLLLLAKMDLAPAKYLHGIKIWEDERALDKFSFDIRMLSKEAKIRIVKAIELEITSKLEELQKEFNSLKIMKDE